MDIEWAWVADRFGVLHDILYELFGVLHDILYSLFDAWYHKHPQKCPKTVQNWPFYDSFMVAMVTEFIFFIIFILNLIGLDKPVILVYHMTCFKLLLVWRSPITAQKQWKWQKIGLSNHYFGFHSNQNMKYKDSKSTNVYLKLIYMCNSKINHFD